MIDKQLTYRWPKSESRKNCKVCKRLSKSSDHDYIYKLGECVNIRCNENEKCTHRIHIACCSASGKTYLYKRDQHNSLSFHSNVHGITLIVKNLIEDLIYNYDSRPKRIAVIFLIYFFLIYRFIYLKYN